MRIRLLLVDDDRLVSRVLARALNRLPIDVVVADSFDDAVAAMQQQAFAAVASDFMMGRRNGPDVLAWCAEERPAMRRILFTGVVNPSLLAGIVASGRAHCVLLKPFSALELQAALVAPGAAANVAPGIELA